MPDRVFIADAPPPDDPGAEARRLEAEAAEMATIAEWAEWLSTQSATVQALATEWGTAKASHFTFSERVDKQFRRVFVVQGEHGYHESLQSYEHALFLLVDSHRVRAEDKPETRTRIQAWGGSYADPKVALRTAQRLGREVAKERGRLPVADHDAAVLGKLTAIETADAALADRQRAEGGGP